MQSDFYSGFEGEPEIQFVLKAGQALDRTVRVWSGYFDWIMDRIEPVDGCWTGLALPYPLGEGWIDAPWKVEDLDLIIDQWRNLHLDRLDPTCFGVHAAILAMREEATGSGRDPRISEDGKSGRRAARQ